MEINEKLLNRFVRGHGLINKPLSEWCTTLSVGTRMDSFDIIARDTTLADALEYLSTLTFPATRYVFFPIENATAVVNNMRDGSDFSLAGYFAKKLSSRAARIVNSGRTIWSGGGMKEVTQYEARMLELYGDDGNLIRSISCADDGGRWDFDTYGEPHPVELTFDYAARRKRDRLTAENLRTLIEAYGLPWLSPNGFAEAGQYVLMKKSHQGPDEWQRQIEESACTIEQADDPAYGYYRRGQTWVRHMETHATSVICDFEKALRMNPSYEPLVRSALETAYAIVARGKDV